MADEVRLSRLVHVRSRFTRSVSLPRDWERHDALDGYILTPSGRGILERLISSLDGRSPAPGVVFDRSTPGKRFPLAYLFSRY